LASLLREWIPNGVPLLQKNHSLDGAERGDQTPTLSSSSTKRRAVPLKNQPKKMARPKIKRG